MPAKTRAVLDEAAAEIPALVRERDAAYERAVEDAASIVENINLPMHMVRAKVSAAIRRLKGTDHAE